MTSKSSVAIWTKSVTTVGVLLFVLLASLSFGQQLTGTLNGTVVDSAGAVVPNAQVTFKNEASGDTRSTVSNGSGYFSITAIQPGSYAISVNANGFKAWHQSGITFNQGDSRTVGQVTLQVGDAKEIVEITAGAEVAIPDTAEVSTTLNTRMVQDIALAGRDAGELLKLMPGMALTSGNGQGSSFNTKLVGTNSGPVGAYSSNGTQPNGAMAFMLDGANLVDPGNAGTQIANINQDMVSEVKVLMSSYSAEYAKGPTIFQAISKSGGSQFHGEGYMYARNSIFNSWDYNNKKQYLNQLSSTALTPAQKAELPSQLKADERYYYYGGNVGGPVRLPWMNFNKNRDKMFFWVGYEYMNQHPAGTPTNMLVPTPDQLAGDFTNPASSPYFYTPTQINGMNGAGFQYATNGAGNVAAQIDPNIAGILKLYPKPNEQPSSGNGWNNYQFINTSPQNRWELTGKVDYAFSENTKLTVSYTRQIETDLHPVAIWWAPSWTLPYPSPVQAATTSQDVMANFTHVFSPTTTNEFVFTYARYINPSTLTNPDAVDRTKLGFNVDGLFGHTTSQMPNFYGPWGGAFPDWRIQSFDGGFQGTAFGATKSDPAFYDNFTKVIGPHTLKTGFYWDSNGNVQSNGGNDNGVYNLGWGPNSTGNVIADFVTGKFANYQQASAVPVQTLQYHQWSIYAQDSFKANRQLTLNYGLRFDHMGQWYGGGNAGFQVWDPSTYVNGTPGTATDSSARITGDNTGLTWNARNSSIPLSGIASPLFYYEPRVGLAYDIFGTGKTVLRAGFATFRYQFAENDVLGAAGGPAGLFTYTSPGSSAGFASIATFTPPSNVAQNGADNVQAFIKGDNQTPRVINWNVTVSESLPWRSVFEISYVANKSTGELINGANDKIGDINAVLPGAYFTKDAVLGWNQSPSPLSCNNAIQGGGKTVMNDALDCSNTNFGTPNSSIYALPTGGSSIRAFNQNDFRRLTNYQNLYLIGHGGYSNYNSLQASWQKQSGPVTFLTNYTFSKVLGTRDGQTDNGAGNGRAVDPFNLKNNYGPLAYDHTHIVNLSYVWNLPKFVHNSKVLGGAINGWQISGYTTFQSGTPLQPNTGGNLNAGFASGLTTPLVGAPDLPDNTILLPNGLKANAVTPATWYGTDQNGGGFVAMLPKVTCDPRKGLSSGQYFNPNCFQAPSYGEMGTLQFPYIKNPGYFNSDLGLYKNFQITERQKLQFRVTATNFLNHPLPQFGLAGNSDISLNFQQNSTMTENVASECQLLLNNGSATAPCQVPIVSQSLTNTNTGTTGKPQSKVGSRTFLFSLKYFF